jgi:hypothetical protein
MQYQQNIIPVIKSMVALVEYIRDYKTSSALIFT